MKLLLERWNQFVNEAEGDLAGAKEILKGNNYLKDYADAITDENLVEAGNYIFLYIPPGTLGADDKGTFQHTKASHSRESDLPGSKFNDNLMTDEALTTLVANLLKRQPKPTETEQNPYGTKLKWWNIEMGTSIGLDSIIHKDEVPEANPRTFDFREKIGNNRGIPSIMSQGLTVLDTEGNKLASPEDADPEGQYFIQQDVPVIDGPLQPTEKANLIVGELGTIGSKTLVSLITVFPGVSEPKAMNKKDYAKLGYYFLTGKG